MNVWEIIILGIALSMDAFAISICKGLSLKKMSWKYAIITGLYFGIFQALMPLIGYFLGSQFEHLIKDVDHWIAFGLLLILGLKMIIGDKKDDDDKVDSSFAFKTMVVLAIATSIDALAVGITFSFLGTAIWLAIAIIGVITFAFCFVGVKIGNVFGSKYKSIAEKIGGVILILMGIKILLEHLGVF